MQAALAIALAQPALPAAAPDLAEQLDLGAIVPGDRLTTAKLAGHAMRATDSLRSDGAVLGKAMTGLDKGTGLVLVLVNLQ